MGGATTTRGIGASSAATAGPAMAITERKVKQRRNMSASLRWTIPEDAGRGAVFQIGSLMGPNRAIGPTCGLWDF